MFRKTFIRLILVVAIASMSLVAFAVWQNNQVESAESCDSRKEGDTERPKGDFMILESIGRTFMNTRTY